MKFFLHTQIYISYILIPLISFKLILNLFRKILITFESISIRTIQRLSRRSTDRRASSVYENFINTNAKYLSIPINVQSIVSLSDHHCAAVHVASWKKNNKGRETPTPLLKYHSTRSCNAADYHQGYDEVHSLAEIPGIVTPCFLDCYRG